MNNKMSSWNSTPAPTMFLLLLLLLCNSANHESEFLSDISDWVNMWVSLSKKIIDGYGSYGQSFDQSQSAQPTPV